MVQPDSLVNKQNSAFVRLKPSAFKSVCLNNLGLFKHLSNEFLGGAVEHKAEP